MRTRQERVTTDTRRNLAYTYMLIKMYRTNITEITITRTNEYVLAYEIHRRMASDWQVHRHLDGRALLVQLKH